MIHLLDPSGAAIRPSSGRRELEDDERSARSAVSEVGSELLFNFLARRLPPTPRSAPAEHARSPSAQPPIGIDDPDHDPGDATRR